jgi:serine O-acetyltransferase
MPLLDPRFRDDLRRYPRRPWFREQSIWAIAIYRFGRQNELRRPGLVRWIVDRLYWPTYRVVETLTGISIPKTVDVGGGLRIHHFGCIFVNGASTIGRNCTLRQGVTIGNRHDNGPVPVVDDDVDFGAFAQVLGGVRIGSGARIGALSVVLSDVPPGATAVGAPARMITSTRPEPSALNLQPAASSDSGIGEAVPS